MASASPAHDEIEITEEMIRAEADVFVGYDWRFEAIDTMLERVYKVMRSLEPH